MRGVWDGGGEEVYGGYGRVGEVTVSSVLFCVCVCFSYGRLKANGVCARGKYTLSIPALTFYHVGTKTPSLPVAESREILDLIKPAPDQIAETLAQVMMMCIALREEQEGIMQVLRRVGGRCGVDVDAEGEDGGEVGMVGGQVDAELKTMVEKVEHKLSTFRDGIMSDVESMLQTLRRDLQDTIAPRSRPSSHRPDSDKEDEPVRKRQRKVTRNSLGDDVELVSLPYGNAGKAEVEKKKRLARLSGSPRITVRKEGVNGVESNGLQQQPPNTPTKTVVVPERNGESYHKATAAEEESSRQLEAESLQKDKDGPWIIPNSEDEQSSQALSTQNSLTSIKEARKVKVEVGKEKERDNEAKTKSTRKVAEKRRASGRISRGGK